MDGCLIMRDRRHLEKDCLVVGEEEKTDGMTGVVY